MKAVDCMSSPVHTVRPNAPIRDAIRLMLEKRISGLPVIDQSGKLVGMVTEGDFLRRPETGTASRRPKWLQFVLGPGQLAEEYAQAHGRLVEDVMTREVKTAAEETSIADVVDLMESHRIKRVPIVRDSKLVGIVTRANVMRMLASAAGPRQAVTTDDTGLRDQLLDILRSEPWASSLDINVVVWDGVVHLWGTIDDERHRRPLQIAAEKIAGVKSVRDHLVYEKPSPPIWM